MTAFTAVAEDITNGKFPVRYSFSCIPKGRVAQGAYIVLEMPPEVVPSNIYKMERSCALQDAARTEGGFSYPQLRCDYNETTN
jgi:hypothetical protein